MTKFSSSGGEAKRLAALHALLILDTPPEKRFDNITAFAASEFHVPIAVVSLVDEKRQWFKSKVGLDMCGSARDISICTHGIQSDKPLIVPDLTKDKRFADNPFVTGASQIRFYAGAPLQLASGHIVGMFCIMDTKSRQFSEIDRAILTSLRDLVTAELESSLHGTGHSIPT